MTEISSILFPAAQTSGSMNSVSVDTSPITPAPPTSIASEFSAISAIEDALTTESGVVTGTNWLNPSSPPLDTYSTSVFQPIMANVSGTPVPVTFSGEMVPLPSSAAQISDSQELSDQHSLLEALDRNPDTTAFADLLRQNPAVLKLLGYPNMTYDVFAPSNEAFTKLNKREDEGLMSPQVAVQFTNRVILPPPIVIPSHHPSTSASPGSSSRQRTSSRTLNTGLFDRTWANLGPNTPFKVVLVEPANSPDYRRFAVRESSSTNNITIISGLGKKSKTSSNQIKYTGGTIHVADSFFTKPKNLPATLDELGYKNFKASLLKAGLLDGLSNTPGITVFVPQEDYANANLSNTLLNHLILPKAAKYTPDLMDCNTYSTAAGPNDLVKITSLNNHLFVNDAMITNGNIIIQNGVIHVVDKVIGLESSAPTGGSSGSNSGGECSTALKGSASADPNPSMALFAVMGAAGVFAAFSLWF
jgi:uncharacterized surface protein with fasciclin (FAS1) repeats